jgi:RimJ/RimL family protein N-acetyltransferase
MKKPAKTKKSTQARKTAKGKKRGKTSTPAFYAKSRRLAFRLLDASDEALYCDLFTDPKTMRYVGAPLERERAAYSFQKALEVTQRRPVTQHISVIVERATRKAIGISSIRMLDGERRRAEGGILLKPTAHAQRFATESASALMDEAFRWHAIEELSARVASDHKAGQRLVAAVGYARGETIPAEGERPERSTWQVTRDWWARNSKRTAK